MYVRSAPNTHFVATRLSASDLSPVPLDPIAPLPLQSNDEPAYNSISNFFFLNQTSRDLSYIFFSLRMCLILIASACLRLRCSRSGEGWGRESKSAEKRTCSGRI